MITEFDNPLFLEVERPPVPLEGLSTFLKYIGDNYSYPEEAVNAKVSGRIILSFIVETDGTLSEIKTLHDLGFGTGEEAVRILKASPKWRPGVQNGMVVRTQYTLPIVLNLSNDSE
jgi:protein TonB